MAASGQIEMATDRAISPRLISRPRSAAAGDSGPFSSRHFQMPLILTIRSASECESTHTSRAVLSDILTAFAITEIGTVTLTLDVVERFASHVRWQEGRSRTLRTR